MGWVSGLVVFFLIWWLTLFAVLPIGTRPNPGGRFGHRLARCAGKAAIAA